MKGLKLAVSKKSFAQKGGVVKQESSRTSKKLFLVCHEIVAVENYLCKQQEIAR